MHANPITSLLYFLLLHVYVCVFYRSAVQAASLSACTDCDPGYYCPDTNMTDTGTLQCDAGFYCTQGSMEAAPVNETWGSECPRGVFISLDKIIDHSLLGLRSYNLLLLRYHSTHKAYSLFLLDFVSTHTLMGSVTPMPLIVNICRIPSLI